MPGILTEERRFEEESGGIAHRNLKPANVFLLAGAPVKILDFSLARSVLPDDHGAIHT